MSENYVWLSDTHFDHTGDPGVIALAEEIVKVNPTGIFVTGDIATSDKFVYYLSALEKITQRPIYFVLGNHDYYGSSFENTEKKAINVSSISTHIKYLGNVSYMNIGQQTAVLGVDGWYDALNGSWRTAQQTAKLSDWTLIGDFVKCKSMESIVALSKKRANEQVTSLMAKIKAATRYAKNLIILTHVPPVQMCDQVTTLDINTLVPFFTCRMLDDLMMQAAASYQNKSFMVLAGHTHLSGTSKPANNLMYMTPTIEYGHPVISRIVQVA
jgi:predicted MPP superfamily phosphohydrolase